MPSIYEHELSSYRLQVDQLETPGSDSLNLTHSALAFSNRLHLILIGLCSLVEARLHELAESQTSQIKLRDVRGQGISRLQLFLKRLGVLDFGRMSSWSTFKWLYKLRNSLVHSYGGLVIDPQHKEKARQALDELDFRGGLIDGRRIRLRSEHLERALLTVEDLLREIEEYQTS